MAEADILISRFQNGEKAAFDILVKKLNRQYYNLAYRYLGTKDEAEDIVQSAFLKLWEHPNLFKSELGVKFTTWFYKVVVNMCLDKKKKPIFSSDIERLESNIKQQDEEYYQIQLQNILKDAIISLSARQKTALILCFYEELSNKEAAKIMDINIKALESLIMRAKANLKKFFIKKGVL